MKNLKGRHDLGEVGTDRKIDITMDLKETGWKLVYWICQACWWEPLGSIKKIGNFLSS
jgi:hypothetical protein